MNSVTENKENASGAIIDRTLERELQILVLQVNAAIDAMPPAQQERTLKAMQIALTEEVGRAKVRFLKNWLVDFGNQGKSQ